MTSGPEIRKLIKQRFPSLKIVKCKKNVKLNVTHWNVNTETDLVFKRRLDVRNYKASIIDYIWRKLEIEYDLINLNIIHPPTQECESEKEDRKNRIKKQNEISEKDQKKKEKIFDIRKNIQKKSIDKTENVRKALNKNDHEYEMLQLYKKQLSEQVSRVFTYPFKNGGIYLAEAKQQIQTMIGLNDYMWVPFGNYNCIIPEFQKKIGVSFVNNHISYLPTPHENHIVSHAIEVYHMVVNDPENATENQLLFFDDIFEYEKEEDDDDVEIVRERSVEERNKEGFANAIEIS